MNDFFETIDQTSLLLTPNRRLALSLLNAYEAKQQALNKKAWPTVKILPINTWLKELWHQNDFAKLLLNKSQTDHLWLKIIQNNITNNSQLLADTLVHKIQEAYDMLNDWQLSCNFNPLDCNEDILFFQKCALDFETICKQNQWLPLSLAIDEIVKSQQQLLLPKQLILCGFDEITPKQHYLFQQLEKCGCTISNFDPNQQKSEQYKFAALDCRQEILSMAKWAKNKLEKGNRVGCVVHNLSALRTDVEYIFDKVLADDYDISAGSPLSLFPIVADALQILHLNSAKNDIYKIGRLLHSPFLANAETEYLARSSLAAKLKTLKLSSISLRQILALAIKNNELYSCPQLSAALDQFIVMAKKEFEPKSAKEWISVFQKQLQLFGWPGQRELTFDELTIVNRFDQLCTEFSLLGVIDKQLTRAQALTALQKMATNTIYRPKQFAEKKVKILGMLEAAGLEFDCLWLMGMNSNSWPEIQQPNPFIPINLQRQQNMPHSTANRELNYSKQLMNRFQKSAKKIIFSYHMTENSEELCESPLIMNTPIISAQQLEIENCVLDKQQQFPLKKTNKINKKELQQIAMGDFQGVESRFYPLNASANSLRAPHQIRGSNSQTLERELLDKQESFQLEQLEDSSAPVVNKTESVHGGATIFKLQSLCPFKAFAECRLQAKTTEEISFGLSASERGQLIHSMLETFWHRIKSYEQLMRISEEQLDRIINSSIDQAILTVSKINSEAMKSKFIAIEKKRLHSIIHEWLQLEKSRGPFRVVAQEQNLEKIYQQIPLKLRIDRVDQLPDGSFLIIDYKTGQVSINNLMGDRPQEPQLPLYCLLSNHLPVAAIIFAKIKSGEMKFVGIGSTSDQIPGIEQNTNWQQMQADWHQVLCKIAKDFLKGEASVDPKNPQTCRYCHLSNLCRIKEQNVKF